MLFTVCIYSFWFLNHHHHYVPSVVNRSAVMDLHRSRSCATLIQSLYDIFVHSLMLSVHIVLGLPRPLLPFILPSISNRCIPSPLIICPKYWHFLFLIVFNNDLLVFILCKTSALVLCSFHDILNILLYSHISKASNFSDVTLVSVHVSAPYKSVLCVLWTKNTFIWSIRVDTQRWKTTKRKTQKEMERWHRGSRWQSMDENGPGSKCMARVVEAICQQWHERLRWWWWWW